MGYSHCCPSYPSGSTFSQALMDAQVEKKSGKVLGKSGFHGPPIEGMLEIGYSVDVLERRKGHARGA
jgi:hypothetical protein